MPRSPDLDRRWFLRSAVSTTLTAAAATAVALAPRSASSAVAAHPPLPLQLAREAAPDVDPAGYLVSEKLDGMRACWDGARLRFRSGLPVLAPTWFTARLPAAPLDGELWLGRGRFEDLAGIVRRHAAVDAAWRQVRYVVFDLRGTAGPFEQRVAALQRCIAEASFAPLQVAAQRRVAGRRELRQWFDEVVREGGEGLMLHRADALWRAGRSDALLKLKPQSDAEAVVVAHVPGRGRHLGRLGALHVRTSDGVEFLLGTGLTDAQRAEPPPPGTTVVYTYRGRTASGVPRFASFLRLRDPLHS